MSDVTRILSQIEHGDPNAADDLLPLVYDELRKLAAAKMAQENPGQTLQATGLVHEAYVRLVNCEVPQSWNDRGHFFSAAAQAMRRILVERARRRCSMKQGGDWKRCEVSLESLLDGESPEHMLAVHDAIEKLETENPQIARLVELRYFAGFSAAEAAAAIGVSARTAQRYWLYAKSWLLTELQNSARF